MGTNLETADFVQLTTICFAGTKVRDDEMDITESSAILFTINQFIMCDHFCLYFDQCYFLFCVTLRSHRIIRHCNEDTIWPGIMIAENVSPRIIRGTVVLINSIYNTNIYCYFTLDVNTMKRIISNSSIVFLDDIFILCDDFWVIASILHLFIAMVDSLI